MRVIFMGSPEFALPSLRSLFHRCDLALVITQPDRPAGRGRKVAASAVKIAAVELGIPLLQPTRLQDPNVISEMSKAMADVIVVAAYGRILPPQLLSLPSCGCVNVHASLLPRWRGAAPIQAAILHGDSHTGVTIMKMDPGLDTGPIIAQRSTPILPDETGGDLSARLADLGANLLLESLQPYCSGELPLTPQQESGATSAPMLTKADGRIVWHAPAIELERQVRAFEPWPTSYFHWEGRRITVRKSHIVPDRASQPGVVRVIDGIPAVGTSSDLLALDIIQPAGRKPIEGSAFLNGAPSFPEARLDIPA
jgi:methionyl-tRNA formyltransferase